MSHTYANTYIHILHGITLRKLIGLECKILKPLVLLLQVPYTTLYAQHMYVCTYVYSLVIHKLFCTYTNMHFA